MEISIEKREDDWKRVIDNEIIGLQKQNKTS
jgi:hypothetical protein